MKTVISIAMLFALPCLSHAQTSPSKSNDCPLSHWSTTGAACYYAPDLPASEEAKLKFGKPLQARYLLISKPFVAPNHLNFGLAQSALDSLWNRPIVVPARPFLHGIEH